jgi:hypothetical protein
MIIWLLAVILIASVAALGYRQGAIRVAFSFVGILVGALLAVPLGHLLSKLTAKLGVKDPLLLWALGPVLVFIIISAAFKIGAFAMHQKVDVYYKYHAGDLRMALWERLNARIGLCLGVLNGVAYAILLSFLLYVPAYACVQVQTSDQDPSWLRFLASLGRGLNSSGIDKVARSIDSMPEVNYRMVDLAALVYHNPLALARLASYPGFLSLAETPAFADMSTDKSIIDPWQRQVPIMEILQSPRVMNVRNDPELQKLIWNATAPNVDDLKAYLASGRSAKYDPTRVLGRWKFDVGAAIAAMRRAKPTMSSRDMQNLRRYMEAAFGKTTLIARPDHSVSLKNTPGLKLAAGAPATAGLQNLQGQWKDMDSAKYQLSFSGNDLFATVEGDRLAVKSEGMDLVFNRED